MPKDEMEDRIASAQSDAVKDADDGKYDPPQDLVSELFASDKDMQVDKAYRDEWHNHNEQTK